MKSYITLSSRDDAHSFLRGMPISLGIVTAIVTAIDHQHRVLTVRPWRWYDSALWPARKATRWIGWRLVHYWIVARYWYHHAKRLLRGDR